MVFPGDDEAAGSLLRLEPAIGEEAANGGGGVGVGRRDDVDAMACWWWCRIVLAWMCVCMECVSTGSMGRGIDSG
jgi:hypothetical protein